MNTKMKRMGIPSLPTTPPEASGKRVLPSLSFGADSPPAASPEEPQVQKDAVQNAVIEAEVVVASPSPSTPSTPSTPVAPVSGEAIEIIDVGKIFPSRYQPRLVFDPVKLQALADSIDPDEGLRTPIKVRRMPNNTFELIAGERRWRAHKLKGLATIKAIVVSVDDLKANVLTALDNDGGEPLTDFERALKYQALLDDGIFESQSDIARRTATSRDKVLELFSFFKLPKPCIEQLTKNPELVTSAYAQDFARLAQDGPGIVEEAFVRIERGMKMTAALNWAKGEMNPSKPVATVRHVSLGGRYAGTARLTGNRLEITCNSQDSAKAIFAALNGKQGEQVTFHENLDTPQKE